MLFLGLRNELDHLADTQVKLIGTNCVAQEPPKAEEETTDFSAVAENIVSGIPNFFKGLFNAISEDFGASITPSDSDMGSSAYQWGTGFGHALTEVAGLLLSAAGKVLGAVALLASVGTLASNIGQQTVVIGAVKGGPAAGSILLFTSGEVLQARSHENADKSRKKFREHEQKTKKESSAPKEKAAGKKGEGEPGKGKGESSAGKTGEPGSGKPGGGEHAVADTRNAPLTKEQLATKPKNSRDVKKWIDKGGHITIDKDGVWEYHDWDGNSVKYPDGYPDFESANMVKRDVNIDQFISRSSDESRANAKAMEKYNEGKREGYTWHHNQDMKTMQEVKTYLHKRFTHEGGISKLNKMADKNE